MPKSIKWFKPGRELEVNNKMQNNIIYVFSEPVGQNFDPSFKPYYTPQEMLELGVFEGKYINDCAHELPKEWFETAKIVTNVNGVTNVNNVTNVNDNKPDPSLNLFGVKSRQSLQTWRKNGWITPPYNRGWFHWYIMYYLGVRIEDVDEENIKRWRSFRRHEGQILASYDRMKKNEIPRTRGEKKLHRAKQRQALLQWAYNPWI